MLNVQIFDAYGTVTIKGIEAVENRIKKLQELMASIPNKVDIHFSPVGGVAGAGYGGGYGGGGVPGPGGGGRDTTGAGIPGYRARGINPSLAVDRYADPVDRLERDLRRAELRQVRERYREKQRIGRDEARAMLALDRSIAQKRRLQAQEDANAVAFGFRAQNRIPAFTPAPTSYRADAAAIGTRMVTGQASAADARVLAAGSPYERQMAARRAHYEEQKQAIEATYRSRMSGVQGSTGLGTYYAAVDSAERQRRQELAALNARMGQPFREGRRLVADPDAYKAAIGDKAAIDHAVRTQRAQQEYEGKQAAAREKYAAEAAQIRRDRMEVANKIRDEHAVIARSAASPEAKDAARIEARKAIDINKETQRAMLADLARRAAEEKNLHAVQMREAIQTSKVLQTEAKAAGATQAKEAKAATAAVKKNAELAARRSAQRAMNVRQFASGAAMGAGLPMMGGSPLGLVGYAATQAFQYTVGHAIDSEKSMADIRAVLGYSPEQTLHLRKALFGVGKQVAGVTNDEVVGMAAELVRADNTVTDPTEIATAAKFMALMKNAMPGMDPHDMVRKGLKITHAFGVPSDKLEGVGSMMVAMDQSSVASAADILDFTSRIAGSGHMLGVSLPEIVAIAATAKDVGVNNETGTSAIAQVWQRMGTNPALFAEKLGVSEQEFKTMFNRSPVEALSAYLRKGAALTDNTERMQYFGESGFKGYRVSDTVGKLTTAMEKTYRPNLALAQAEFDHPTVLAKRQAVMGDTVSAKITQVQNLFQELAVEVGSEMLPALKSFADYLKESGPEIKGFLKEIAPVGQALGQLGVSLGRISAASLAGWGEIGNLAKVAAAAPSAMRNSIFGGPDTAFKAFVQNGARLDLGEAGGAGELGVAEFAAQQANKKAQADAMKQAQWDLTAKQKEHERNAFLRANPHLAAPLMGISHPILQAWNNLLDTDLTGGVKPHRRRRMAGRFADEAAHQLERSNRLLAQEGVHGAGRLNIVPPFAVRAPKSAQELIEEKKVENENKRHIRRIEDLGVARNQAMTRPRRRNESQKAYEAAMLADTTKFDRRLAIENDLHASRIEDMKLRAMAQAEAAAKKKPKPPPRGTVNQDGLIQGYDSKILGGSQLSHTIQTDILNAARAKKEQKLIDALNKNAKATENLVQKMAQPAPLAGPQAFPAFLG